MSAEDVAAAFVNHYYTTLGSNPSALMGLYVSGFFFACTVLLFANFETQVFVCNVQQPQSVLTFEGQKFEGPQKIIEKFVVSCFLLYHECYISDSLYVFIRLSVKWRITFPC